MDPKNGYRKRIGISNIVTGKELVSQIWLPEKIWYLKYGYQKRIGISNIVTTKFNGAKKQALYRCVDQ